MSNNDKNNKNEIKFKILIIGESAVGKSCLLTRLSENSFNENWITTVGIDFKTKKINIDGKNILLQIWDTAGQERFKTITRAFYRGAMGILFVFDITNRRSFEKISDWVQDIKTNTDGNIINMLLVGNKSDLVDKRQVSSKEAEELANKFNMTYLEVSAKTGFKVEESFILSAEAIYKYLDENNRLNINLNNGNNINNQNNTNNLLTDLSNDDDDNIKSNTNCSC